jgi:hypothetical protein
LQGDASHKDRVGVLRRVFGRGVGCLHCDRCGLEVMFKRECFILTPSRQMVTVICNDLQILLNAFIPDYATKGACTTVKNALPLLQYISVPGALSADATIVIDKLTTIAECVCPSPTNKSCTPSSPCAPGQTCSAGTCTGPAQVKFSCDELHFIFGAAVLVPEVQKLFTTHLNLDVSASTSPSTTVALCKTMLTQLTPAQVTTLVKGLVNTQVQKLSHESQIAVQQPLSNLIDQIPQVLACICAGLKAQPAPSDKPSKEPSKGTTIKPEWNWNIVLILIVIAAFLILFPACFICGCISTTDPGLPELRQHPQLYAPYLEVHKGNQIKVAVSIVCLAVAVAVTFGLLMYYNPWCMLKTCVTSSEKWIPLSNEKAYSGHVTVLGVTIDGKVTGTKDADVISLNLLTCDGVPCKKIGSSGSEHVDMIQEFCKRDNQVTLDLKHPTPAGYALTGACVTNLRKIKTGPATLIQGMWMGIRHHQYYLQVALTISIGGAIIKKNVTVVLEPVSAPTVWVATWNRVSEGG